MLRETLQKLPRRIKIELVEIKYSILKKDVLDEFYIAEYEDFNRILSALTRNLWHLLFQLDEGVEESPDLHCILNDILPPSLSSKIGDHLPKHSLRAMIEFLCQQREHFRLVIESNFKLLLELRFFREPKKLLGLAKQILCRKHGLLREDTLEEFKIYDSPALNENVLYDIENCQGPGYFVKGLYIVGAGLHFVDQKLTKTHVSEKSLFSACPLLFVCLVPTDSAKRTPLKSHSLPVYKFFPRLRNVFTSKKPQIESMYCLQCMEFFFQNYESLGVDNPKLAKLLFDIKNKLMFDSSLDLYQVVGSQKVLKDIKLNLNRYFLCNVCNVGNRGY